MSGMPLAIVDELPVLEQKAAFIAAACIALGMLSEDELAVYADKKVWEGLGWYADEISLKIRELNEKANPSA